MSKTEGSTSTPRVLRLREVSEITQLSESTIRRRVRERAFPQPLRLSGNAIGWLEGEIHEWLRSRERVGTRTSASSGASRAQGEER